MSLNEQWAGLRTLRPLMKGVLPRNNPSPANAMPLSSIDKPGNCWEYEKGFWENKKMIISFYLAQVVVCNCLISMHQIIKHKYTTFVIKKTNRTFTFYLWNPCCFLYHYCCRKPTSIHPLIATIVTHPFYRCFFP